MTLHRFFVDPAALQSETVTFSRDQSHQISRVLRLVPGDEVIALDGSGAEYLVRLTEARGEAAGAIVGRGRNEAEPALRLRLYQGILKGAKLEMVWQKCTEVGVTSFVPVVTRRSVAAEPGAARQRRFDSIVREAAEQSRRGIIPPILPPMPYQTALGLAAEDGPVIVLWEDEGSQHLEDVDLSTGGRLSLFVGPEGGLSADEIEAARAVGAITVTLGKRILRAETAAIVGSALLLARAGDLG